MIWITTALAGFYHPIDVAAGSRAYDEAAAETSGRASALQRQARSYAIALNDYEEALDLLGPRADPSERATHASLTKAYNRQLAVLQVEIDELVAGFDTAFGDALTRALQAHPGAVRCEKTVASGPSLPGMPGRRVANPACTGDDVNQALADAMDRDAALRLALTDLFERRLSAFDLPAEPAPLAAESWIGVAPLFQAASRDALRTLRRSDEEARLEIEAAMEEGATPEQLAALRPKAAAITAATAAARAEAFAPALERADKVLAKKLPGAGWCARPELLGGCSGEDVTKAGAALLSKDAKFGRLLP